MSKSNLFIASVITSFILWAVLAWLNMEPWDLSYWWIIVGTLGLLLGFISKESPWLCPLGIYLGSALFGLGNFLKNFFFYSGGGVDLFIPLGMLFLIPFSFPALIGSFLGFGIKKATTSCTN